MVRSLNNAAHKHHKGYRKKMGGLIYCTCKDALPIGTPNAKLSQPCSSSTRVIFTLNSKSSVGNTVSLQVHGLWVSRPGPCLPLSGALPHLLLSDLNLATTLQFRGSEVGGRVCFSYGYISAVSCGFALGIKPQSPDLHLTGMPILCGEELS